MELQLTKICWALYYDITDNSILIYRFFWKSDSYERQKFNHHISSVSIVCFELKEPIWARLGSKIHTNLFFLESDCFTFWMFSFVATMESLHLVVYFVPICCLILRTGCIENRQKCVGKAFQEIDFLLHCNTISPIWSSKSRAALLLIKISFLTKQTRIIISRYAPFLRSLLEYAIHTYTCPI